MLKKILFFSKCDGEKLKEKIDKLIEKQKTIENNFLEIKAFEDKLFRQNTLVLNEKIRMIEEKITKQNEQIDNIHNKYIKDIENIYSILNNLLLRDLMEKYSDEIKNIIKDDLGG